MMNNQEQIKRAIEILEEVKGYMEKSTDFNWCPKDMVDKYIGYISECVDKLKQENVAAMSSVLWIFYPTSEFQDLSIDNGWGDQYCALASEYEDIYVKLNTQPGKSKDT